MTSEAPSRVAPLSRPVALADIPPAGRRYDIETSEAERKAVAEQIGLPAIARLAASLEVRHWGKEGLQVEGEVRARLTQTCVVTAADFESDVTAPVEIRFSPQGVDPNAEIDLADLIDPEADDPPDLMVGGRIDLGTVTSEFLALGLDPYPKKPGVVFETEGETRSESPFSALSALKKDI